MTQSGRSYISSSFDKETNVTKPSASILLILLAITSLLRAPSSQSEEVNNPNVMRLGDGPIITQNMDDRMGGNVQGPSLIRVPDWIENPLGKYYLYFADHRGTYIRLAYADDLSGPWKTHEPGSLQLDESHFPTSLPTSQPGTDYPQYAHIASPDVHVRDDLREILMYVHGQDPGKGPSRQVTRLAISKDGISFEGQPEVLGRPYFRVVQHNDDYYAIAMPGYLYRSQSGTNSFAEGPQLFNDDMRHSALLIRGDTLYVFWTQAGHSPERIFLSKIDMQGDWLAWQASEPTEILRPKFDWEGANLGIEPSIRGYIDERANQLRDPAIFREGEHIYLLYSVAGESGIAIAELKF